MGLRSWWAQQQLKTAARLLERGILNRSQYGYLAIKYGYQIIGEPLRAGTEVEYFHFTVALSHALAEGIPPERQDHHWEPFGPFPEASISLMMAKSVDLPSVLTWSGSAESASKAAALQLRLYHRVALRIQEWWIEQKSTWPVWSAVLLSFLSGVAGWVIRGLTGK